MSLFAVVVEVNFKGRRILISAGGGVGVVKVALLASSLRKRGADLKIVLTDAASRFVSPLLFKSLSWGDVYTDKDWWSYRDSRGCESPILHVELARWAELITVAPATADLMAKASIGISDNLALSIMTVASPDRILFIPSMNTNMLNSPPIASAMKRLSEFGATVVGTSSGVLACGDEGRGRIPEVPVMELLIYRMLRERDFSGKFAGTKVVVTAGPTREYMDTVRFISNASSGKLGLSIALELWAIGCDVKLVHGPSPAVDEFKKLSMGYSFPGLEFIPVVSASEMLQALRSYLGGAALLFMAAAVSDYRFENIHSSKLRRSEFKGSLSVNLVENPDILKTLSSEFPDVRKVAFTVADKIDEKSLEIARKKLVAKGADWIVLNDTSAIGADRQRVVFLSPGEKEFEITEYSGPKDEVARFLVEKALVNLN